MKANNGTGNNEGRDMWRTPQGLFEALNKQYHFTIDCCANTENNKCPKGIFFHNFELADTQLIEDSCCWMNPPFSKAKEMFKHFFNVVQKGVAIYRSDNMESHSWQTIIFPQADWILIPLHRICYGGFQGNKPRFPSALIGVGVAPPLFVVGQILYPRKEGCKRILRSWICSALLRLFAAIVLLGIAGMIWYLADLQRFFLHFF